MEEFFEQYKQPGEEYQSPGYAFKDGDKLYHMGIYVKNGEGQGYALYSDAPFSEEEKEMAMKNIGGMLVSFKRVKKPFWAQYNTELKNMKKAKKEIREWAVTEEEQRMAARYEEYFEVILTARELFLSECQKLVDLEQRMFKNGYFEKKDKEYMDSILINIDAISFISIKRQYDDFEKNIALCKYVENKRNTLGFFKYRHLKKTLSISTLDSIYEKVEASMKKQNSKFNWIQPILPNIDNEELREEFAAALKRRDKEIARQIREKLRN
ncbi:hypothetical protein AC622_18420 [Bacillus sp. FJAT-27916]|uniref:hypothetical protein n=1 Tax=Bacillus sp. FJAT-27916 TaxID=1679169 RepID=UPI000670B503|nr:hypothetical protein [Bacillus sp. FJAT-27916]KMY45930.1 hypothetical protein AC622_18420 [Bacillus sp. FJAT-27916]